MEMSALLVLLATFGLISLLPQIYFRRDGKLTLMWLVTALPYGLVPLLVIYLALQEWPLWLGPDTMSYTICAGLGVLFSCISIGLISMTIGTHRVPLALWHQNRENDEPVHIVTWGSYKYIRHPFYSSFLLAWCAAMLILPHVITLGLTIYTVLMLNFTARREEERLAQEPDPLGAQYRAYMVRTGRFLWRLRAAEQPAGEPQTGPVQAAQ